MFSINDPMVHTMQ